MSTGRFELILIAAFLPAGCASFFIPTKTSAVSAVAAHSVGAAHGFPEESGGIFRNLSAKIILLAASPDDPVSACRRYLKAYQKSARAFNLSKIEMAVALCEEAGGYQTAELFLNFKTRYLESHPYEVFHYKSQWQRSSHRRWQRSSHRRWQRQSKATLRKDFDEYLSEQPRCEPTVNYTPAKSPNPSSGAYHSVIPYYHYEKK